MAETISGIAARGHIDYWRQLDVFNPEKFETPIHIIGVGASGSWIAYILAKMGIRSVTAWDHDLVEVHNLPNQIFGLEEIGMPKVLALARILARDCGTEVVARQEKATGLQPLSGIVFLCVDSMSARKEIWEKALKFNPNVKLVVETRLGAEFCIVHTIRPLYPADVRGFENTLFGDDEAEAPACTYRAISTVVAVVAGIAAHKVIKWANAIETKPVVKVAEGEDHESNAMLCIRPVLTTSAAW